MEAAGHPPLTRRCDRVTGAREGGQALPAGPVDGAKHAGQGRWSWNSIAEAAEAPSRKRSG